MLGLGFLDGMVIISIGLFVVALALIILSFTNTSASVSEHPDVKPVQPKNKMKLGTQPPTQETTPEQYAPHAVAEEEMPEIVPLPDDEEENLQADEGEEQPVVYEAEKSSVIVLSLIDYNNGDNNKKYTFEKQDETISVGRHGKNDIVILNPMVSAKHCRISRIDDKIFILDLGSTNGTVLHGKKITEKTEIKSGDKLRLGDIDYTVEI